jgi:galactitol-specific phosphotransferase system IIC component
MLFASAFGDQMFLGFCLFCFLCWFAMRKFKQVDSEGVIKKAARDKLFSTITRWLK